MAAARWLLTLAFLSAVTLAAMLLRARSAPHSDDTLTSRDLEPWALLGCYELEVEPWDAERMVALRGSEAPQDLLLTAFEFPEAIMLQLDSLDAWGRPLGSYRVVALAPQDDTEGLATSTGEALGSEGAERAFQVGPLRWYTRSDTLWILGSIPGARIGIALFDAQDSLVGQAGLVARAGRRSAMAPAGAWPINCATRARTLSPDPPRR
jgi:hypothetical protein